MPLLHFSTNMLVALLCGFVIGIERQWRQRTAGLRTNALVALGAALFVALSGMVVGDNSPTRIAAQVVSGIGFLGAGVILHEGFTVHGLNTAATLWCSAAVGTLAGCGYKVEAFLGTLFVVGTNVILRPIAHKINRQPLTGTEVETRYRIRVVCRESDETRIRTLLLTAISSESLMLQALNSEDIPGSSGQIKVSADVLAHGRRDQHVESIVSRVSFEEGISSVSWEIRHA
jgi:putative Mg2+ transporter-C (MgtC) family protein